MNADRQRELARKVGSAIAQRRERAHLTQAQLAEMLGLGLQAISRIERGAVLPTLPRLFEFAEAFRCRVDELLLSASDRDSDLATAMARQLAHLQPRDREFVASLVKLLADHLPKRTGDKRK